ncbi:hypothetical protein [Glaciecola sp. MF2-115]|uniref:hypothetical protein n=1 Tax=Glaciecola sp. MF2-115 TaxID=3384827 RepID=UPI0039A0BE22
MKLFYIALLFGAVSILLGGCNDDSSNFLDFSTDFYGVVSYQPEITDDILKDSVVVHSTTEFFIALSEERQRIVFAAGEFDLGVVNIDYKVALEGAPNHGTTLMGGTFLYLNHDGIKVSSFKWLDGASPSGGRFAVERFGVISVSADSVFIESNIFINIGVNSTVKDKTGIAINLVASDYAKIIGNEFVNSRAIAIKTDDFSRHLNVKFNTFKDSLFFDGAGEVLHVGNGFSVGQAITSKVDDTFAEFSNNFIENWSLERELISIKTSKNKIYNNLFNRNGFSAIVIRMGNENEVFDNIMVESTEFPIRISGEKNKFYGNIFCGLSTMISLHSERKFSSEIEDLVNSYWAANDNLIVGNTFVGFESFVNINEGYAAEGDDYFVALPKMNKFQKNIIFSKNLNQSDFISDAIEVSENQIFDKKITCRVTNHDT